MPAELGRCTQSSHNAATMSFPALSLRLRPSPSFQLYSFLKHPSTSPACQQVRYNSKNVQAQKKQRDAEKSKKKKKQRSEYLDPDLAKLEQFNLCDAMRYCYPTPLANSIVLTHRLDISVPSKLVDHHPQPNTTWPFA